MSPVHLLLVVEQVPLQQVVSKPFAGHEAALTLFPVGLQQTATLQMWPVRHCACPVPVQGQPSSRCEAALQAAALAPVAERDRISGAVPAATAACLRNRLRSIALLLTA